MTKIKNKGYKPPKWFQKIKPSNGHGSSPTQKRFWRVVSETYRQEDFEKYNGRCVSCAKRLHDWKDGQLAHYKAYGACNSWFKFDRMNLALSCAACNFRDDGPVGYAFGQELKRRHGEDILEKIEKENQKYIGQKMHEKEIVERVAIIKPELVEEEND